MCLSAIYWSHIDKIYYGNTRKDAAKIGFDDNFIYDELSMDLNKRKIKLEQVNQQEAIKAFQRKVGLIPDGVAGNRTKSAMRSYTGC